VNDILEYSLQRHRQRDVLRQENFTGFNTEDGVTLRTCWRNPQFVNEAPTRTCKRAFPAAAAVHNQP